MEITWNGDFSKRKVTQNVLRFRIQIVKELYIVSRVRRELNSPNSCLLGLFDNSRQLRGFGCFWAILEEAHITLLMIHPDVQGQGLGKLLTSETFKVEILIYHIRHENQSKTKLLYYFL